MRAFRISDVQQESVATSIAWLAQEFAVLGAMLGVRPSSNPVPADSTCAKVKWPAQYRAFRSAHVKTVIGTGEYFRSIAIGVEVLSAPSESASG